MSYIVDAKTRNAIHSAVAKLKASDISKAIGKHAGKYTNCGEHYVAYQSGKDIVGILAMFVGLGEIKAAVKSGRFLESLASSAAKNIASAGRASLSMLTRLHKLPGKVVKVVVKIPQKSYELVLVGTNKVIGKLENGVLYLKQTWYIQSTRAKHVLLQTEEQLNKFLDELLGQPPSRGGGLAYQSADGVLTFNGQKLPKLKDSKDDALLKIEFMKGKGGALDWVGLLSDDVLKAIKNWDDDLKLALHSDLKASDDLVKALKDVRLVDSWAVLHKAESNGVAKLGKKGELEGVRKYLDENPSKSVNDVAKEVQGSGGYEKWVKSLTKSIGFTTVKLGSMRTLTKAKVTAAKMEEALEGLLLAYKQKFAGLAKGLPDELRVILSNIPPSGYSHSTTIEGFVSRMQKKNIKLSSDDIKALKTMEANGKLEKVLMLANTTYSNKNVSVLKNHLDFKGVIAHELGHAFHWNTRMVTNSSFIHRSVDNLYANCESIFRSLPKSTLQLLKPKNAQELRKLFGKQVDDIDDKALEYYWDAVGDLSLALSKGQTGFGRLDKLSYYSSKNTPQKELIAHTSDYYLNGNPLFEKVFGKNIKLLLDDFGDTYFK